MATIEGISITLDVVSATAKSIGELNSKLDTKLYDIKKEMNSLTSTWNSDAADTIQKKFNGLEERFKEYKDIIDSYVRFLNTTVTNYNEAETAINNNAGQFK